jgi:hypothetical protein
MHAFGRQKPENVKGNGKEFKKIRHYTRMVQELFLRTKQWDGSVK